MKTMDTITISDIIYVNDIKSLKRIVDDTTVTIIDSGFSITVDKGMWNLLTINAPIKSVALADLD